MGPEDQKVQRTRGHRRPVGERTSGHSGPEEQWVRGLVVERTSGNRGPEEQ